jgi:Family of unknown function (DUF5995)
MVMSSTTRLRWTGVVSALTALATLVMPAAPASASDDPPFIGWTAQLAPLPVAYDPSSSDVCVAGKVSCVQRTIATMQKRYAPLSTSCAHTGVFALTYLVVTQTYLSSATTKGFYSDPAFVNHEDSVFASLYFSAYDSWAAGKRANVPVAWRLALDAAKDRQVTAEGDLLLGINAHVLRDLPFTLAAIGLTKPDGTSRKPDHDKVDQMLNQAINPLIAKLAAHYDSSLAIWTPADLGYTSLMQLLAAWRETAWREAEQLTLAPTAAARATVAATIESTAATQARSIIASTRFLPPVTTTAGRDAYCAAYVAGGGR